MLIERAYAKINLTLDVVGKREDGYHEVNMVMQTIDLSDTLYIEKTAGTSIVMDSTATHIPLDGRNLAVMAAQTFLQYSGIRQGLRIRLDKQIPVAAGLAGGSADAAAVLKGLNRLFGTGYRTKELAEMGAAIGSDVPFCVHGGCAIARGRGEQIEPIAHHCHAWVVLTRPPVFVSTQEVYQATQPSQYNSNPNPGPMIEALQAGDLDGVRTQIRNGLQETTFRLYDEVQTLQQKMESVTGNPVYMSGSGPTLYVLVPTQTAANRVYNALRGFMKDVHLARFVLL